MSTTDEIRAKITTLLAQSSPRERLMGAAGLLVMGGLVLYSFVIAPAQEAFAKQSQEITALENTYTVAPDILARYGKLVARKKEIEQFYQKVDLKSDPLSHLERLLRETAKVPAGAYSVSTREGAPFDKYSHKIFVVKFETTSLPNLAAFLKDLTGGQQPMLLSQINLEKRSSGDILQVQLEVSGFEVIAK